MMDPNEMPPKVAGAFAQAYREENRELREENEWLRAVVAEFYRLTCFDGGENDGPDDLDAYLQLLKDAESLLATND